MLSVGPMKVHHGSNRLKELPMRLKFVVSVAILLATSCTTFAQSGELRERRARAAAAFPDGVLLLHARSSLELAADGFRQDPFFYYYTGLENTAGALLAIDGASRESWLFLPSKAAGIRPEMSPGPESAKQLGMEHVVDWGQLESFLGSRASSPIRLHFVADRFSTQQLPPDLLEQRAASAPPWLNIIKRRWPAFELADASPIVSDLMAVQSAVEMKSVRAAAHATVAAVKAGMRAIKPGSRQRKVELEVTNACWKAGAHGPSFWPWALAGENGVFPKPWLTLSRYDHLDSVMKAGDLVRLDVGCEWEHYSGDLGRTVPVSGRYTADQRETWNVFVSAYLAGARILREGVTVDQVFDAWRTELLKHRSSVKSSVARRAIEQWSDRKNIPFWQVHTMNLEAGLPKGGLRAGTTIDFEPIASIDGQGYYLEDMYWITKNGAENLTTGVPYTADEIEAAMKPKKP
jgi:Xaa-Pro aminopeptidase